jgi:hypothetical protein
MADSLVQNLKTLSEGATYGGGLAWLSTNSGGLTVIAVVCTAIASLYFGSERRKADNRNATANEERNRINERDITSSIMQKLKSSGKSEEYIDDIIETLRINR